MIERAKHSYEGLDAYEAGYKVGYEIGHDDATGISQWYLMMRLVKNII